jgi:hypothetical protein
MLTHGQRLLDGVDGGNGYAAAGLVPLLCTWRGQLHRATEAAAHVPFGLLHLVTWVVMTCGAAEVPCGATPTGQDRVVAACTA